MSVRFLSIRGLLLLAVASVGCKSKEEAKPTPAEPLVVAPPEAGELPAPPDVATPPANAEKTDSGLACVVLREGTGTEHPAIYDSVKMHQVVWTTDGKMHMNTGNREGPVEFAKTLERQDELFKEVLTGPAFTSLSGEHFGPMLFPAFIGHLQLVDVGNDRSSARLRTCAITRIKRRKRKGRPHGPPFTFLEGVDFLEVHAAT